MAKFTESSRLKQSHKTNDTLNPANHSVSSNMLLWREKMASLQPQWYTHRTKNDAKTRQNINTYDIPELTLPYSARVKKDVSVQWTMCSYVLFLRRHSIMVVIFLELGKMLRISILDVTLLLNHNECGTIRVVLTALDRADNYCLWRRIWTLEVNYGVYLLFRSSVVFWNIIMSGIMSRLDIACIVLRH